jgi:hypothetical protein
MQIKCLKCLCSKIASIHRLRGLFRQQSASYGVKTMGARSVISSWAQRVINTNRRPGILLCAAVPKIPQARAPCHEQKRFLFSHPDILALLRHTKAATRAQAVAAISHRTYYSRPPPMHEKPMMVQSLERKEFWRGKSSQTGSRSFGGKTSTFFVYFMAATGIFVWTFEIVERLLAYYFPDEYQQEVLQEYAVSEKITNHFFELENVR